jgi:hypothetical protein
MLKALHHSLFSRPSSSDRNPTNFNVTWYVEITYISGFFTFIEQFYQSRNPGIRARQCQDFRIGIKDAGIQGCAGSRYCNP